MIIYHLCLQLWPVPRGSPAILDDRVCPASRGCRATEAIPAGPALRERLECPASTDDRVNQEHLDGLASTDYQVQLTERSENQGKINNVGSKERSHHSREGAM